MAVHGTGRRGVEAIPRAGQRVLRAPPLDLLGGSGLAVNRDPPAVHRAEAARFRLPVTSVDRAFRLRTPWTRLKVSLPPQPGVMTAAQVARHCLPVATLYCADSGFRHTPESITFWSLQTLHDPESVDRRDLCPKTP